MALDSATLKFLELLAEGDGKPIHECTPEEARAYGSAMAELAGPAPEMDHVTEATIDRPDGEIRLRVLAPIETPRGVIVYYRGADVMRCRAG